MLLAFAAAAIIGMVVAIFAYVATSPGPGPATSAGPSDAAKAGDWIRANIPPGTRLLSAGPSGPADYPTESLNATDQSWHAFTYLLAGFGQPAGDAAPVWQSSTPVAVFGHVQIRRILGVTPEQIVRARDADRTTRLQAGAQLLANADVVVSKTAGDVLRGGGLDLRAAAAVTVLAAKLPVTLNEIVVDPAEAAAGLPARSITVYVPDPRRAVLLLSGITGAMTPDVVKLGPNGEVALHWPLSLTPIPSVN